MENTIKTESRNSREIQQTDTECCACLPGRIQQTDTAIQQTDTETWQACAALVLAPLDSERSS